MVDFIEIQPTRERIATRRGSIYLAVMGVAMIVSIVGIASMQIARLQLRSTTNSQDLEEARLLSQSAIEFGLAKMDSSPDWRAGMTNNVEMTPALIIGNGTMTYALVDDDGDLSDSSNDMVRILGIGRVGEAVYVTSAQLQPAGQGLTSLESSLHTGGVLVRNNHNIMTNQTVSSNGDIDNSAGGGTINGNAWAVGNINGNATGTNDQLQSPPKEMPDPATVFDYYVANGTPIDFSSIPGAKIRQVVVSPGNNPYGSTLNPLGLYLIDCQGNDLTIEESRIYGTLVLLNAGAGSKIDKEINWKPAVANYPALMVQGDIEMRWNGDKTLQEGGGRTYNPAHTPYQGQSDTDDTDEYTGVIQGITYVSGNLTITQNCNLKGTVVVGGVLGVDRDLTLTYDATNLTNPPPGFSSGTVMRLVPGTWQRIAY